MKYRQSSYEIPTITIKDLNKSKPIIIKAKKLTEQIQIKIKVKGIKIMKIRFYIGAKLILFGTKIMGVGLKWED